MRPLLGLLLLGALVPAATGRASTRAFAETYETRTGSQGDAQVETWIDDADGSVTSPNWTLWRFWWGGTASITDALELSVYVTAAQQRGGAADATGQSSTGLELEKAVLMGRYRLVGDGVMGFSLMLQLELGIPMLPSLPDQVALDYLDHSTDLAEWLVLSYDAPHLVVAANLMADERWLLDTTGFETAVKYAAGIAWAPFKAGLHGPPLTVGVEVFGDIPFDHTGAYSIWWPGDFAFAVGPALSFASGRFWATASYGYAPGGAFVAPAVGPAAPVDGFPGPATWSSSEGVGRLIAAFEF
jgi:hypothetical protein